MAEQIPSTQTNPPDATIPTSLDEAESLLPLNHRLDLTRFQQNNPEAYAEYIEFSDEFADQIRQKAIAEFESQGLPVDRALVEFNVQRARRAAVARFRVQAEATGALTFDAQPISAAVRTNPAIQSTNATGTVSVTSGNLESLRQQLTQQRERRADFDRALAATDETLEELRLRLLALNATTGLFDFDKRAERDAVAQKIRELTAQKNSLESTVIPEVDQNIVSLEAQIAAELARLRAAEAEAERQRIISEEQLAEERRRAELENAFRQQVLSDERDQKCAGDWRVKLRLAPNSDYLYNAPNPGILSPLAVSGGVIFPYTPQIQTTYNAGYNTYDLTHSNYRGYFYQNSYVSEVTITATFTAQDTDEANYLLAVIHFFRSATKMFYGQSSNRYRGAPPPLLYLDGYGEFQFNRNPCVVQNFQYVLPQDVDYIKARADQPSNSQVDNNSDKFTQGGDGVLNASASFRRLGSSQLNPGAVNFTPIVSQTGKGCPTYVPTKMDITLTLLPVQTRSQVSRQFSFEKYASGDLVRKGFW